MDTDPIQSGGQREFYLPATPIRSTVPGRFERFATRLLRDRGERVRPTAAAGEVRAFYLPATPRH